MARAEDNLTSQSRFRKYFDKSLLRECICRSLTQLNGLVRAELVNSQVLQKYPGLYIKPNLSPSLVYLRCDNNYIEELPALPATLKVLKCNRNRLARLPELPPNF
jgi:Leucine-rich repeat (LRR) protein